MRDALVYSHYDTWLSAREAGYYHRTFPSIDEPRSTMRNTQHANVRGRVEYHPTYLGSAIKFPL